MTPEHRAKVHALIDKLLDTYEEAEKLLAEIQTEPSPAIAAAVARIKSSAGNAALTLDELDAAEGVKTPRQ